MNVKDWQEPLIKRYWNFLLEKQYELFQSRMIRAQYIVNDAIVRQYGDSLKEIIENQLNQQIADLIGKYIETVTISDPTRPFEHKMTKQCLVLNIGELKHIVDLLVKTIPFEELAKIRNMEPIELEQQLAQFKFNNNDTV